MGNASSATGRRKKKKSAPTPAWHWEFEDGRAQVKPVATASPKRPLFRRQPSDNFNWYIMGEEAAAKRKRKAAGTGRK